MLKSKYLFIVFILCSFISCQESPKSERNPASINAKQPSLFKGEKWSKDDYEAMLEIGDIFRETLIEATGKDSLMRRDAHPKHHGCVTANLNIDNSKLLKTQQVGLFRESKSFKSIIRFSNGDPNFKKDDIEADVRGMAIKIFDVDYESYLNEIGLENESVHDLVMMNADAFFIPNPSAYVKFMRATKGRFGVVGYLLFHWKTLGNILKARVKITNSLDIDYASATPYRLGDDSMKMKFVSCKKNKDTLPKDASPNFLSDRLADTLSKEEGCFDFYVQPNKDLKKNDIENALLFWDEKKSPMIKVGRLTVDKQYGFRDVEKFKQCEAMSFNPWRAPSENRPLGGVNRIRLEVYLNQAKLRADYNN